MASGPADPGGVGRSSKPWPESGFPHRQNPEWDWASGPGWSGCLTFSPVYISFLSRMQFDWIFLNFILEQEHFCLH